MRMDMIYDYREQYLYIYNIEFHVLQGAAIEQLYEYLYIKFIYALNKRNIIAKNKHDLIFWFLKMFFFSTKI